MVCQETVKRDKRTLSNASEQIEIQISEDDEKPPSDRNLEEKVDSLLGKRFRGSSKLQKEKQTAIPVNN